MRIPDCRPRAQLLSGFVVVEDLPGLCPCKLVCVCKDGRQDGIEIKCRAHCVANLAEPLQLFDRSTELRGASLQLVEQPRVLDGDHGLISEGLEHGDLAFRKHSSLGTEHGEGPNRATVAEHGHRNNAAKTCYPR